jgi:hypothetical protein
MAGPNQNMLLVNKSFKSMAKVQILGNASKKPNCINEEIRSR